MIKKRREIYPPRDPEKGKILQAMAEEYEHKRQAELEEEWKRQTPLKTSAWKS